MLSKSLSLEEFVSIQNKKKSIFTAGPASLTLENILGLQPCFGRSDSTYDEIEASVLSNILSISGHKSIVRMQGSASFAMEVMINNFLSGRVLIVQSGFYSNRLIQIAKSAMSNFCYITSIDVVPYHLIDTVSASYDWILSCYTETSQGLRLSIDRLYNLARSASSRLMLDATASIGLEPNHDLADVIAFSSCKGLFGLTGASFISYNDSPTNTIDSFNLSFTSHAQKLMTGPYHAICSLYHVLPNHQTYKNSVQACKSNFLSRMSTFLVNDLSEEPLLCTRLKCKIASSCSTAVLYEPRDLSFGSVVCHLGEVHKGISSNGSINDSLFPIP